ncbi:isoleucine--tRNA ligase [Ureaplasma canigenitalium]|uniref:isoleucine--tRNA ligase n=1 Tax=Ureaplasma canigenitalium TaxID=42092 RepID=UPI00056E9F73|nr:isoleucine--tRNA ligase [Ureaplasma canigenitalium]
MNDYKKTLNMPKTSFSMKANLAINEPKVQEFWLTNDIYQKVLAKNRDKKPFVLHDGPPYANGSIHIGHALNKILKDFIISYFNMNQHYAPYIPGWDTHGLPIEVALMKKIKLKDLSVPEQWMKCEEYARTQKDIQMKQFMRLGMFSDFRDIYLTLDHNFMIDQLKLFETMYKQKYVYQDFKPVYWSWSSQTALAESEIEYGDAVSPAIFVKMYVKYTALFNNKKTCFVIWTTTPWTLLANQAIAINPDVDYQLVELADEQLVIAKNLVDKVMEKVEIKDYRKGKVYSPKELEGVIYHSPINQFENPIILAEYVSTNDGTGLVHNAPGFGLDDYYACKKYGINAIVNIDDYGRFNENVALPHLVGVFYTDANEGIIDQLKTNHNLLHYETITHSVAHDWRTKKPLMYRATLQWFVSVINALPTILNSLENDVTSPNKASLNHIREMVSNRKEWCISRQRNWGVPIPIIFDENKQPINNDEQLRHTIELLDKNGIESWYKEDVSFFLLPQYKNDGKKYFKEKDIMDVWFDSGSSYSILKRHNLPYPTDLYLEGYDQYRGWFNSSIITGCILHRQSPYKTLVAHGMVLDKNGNKMSKSKGNVTDPQEVVSKYGADILRLWIAISDYQADVRISDEHLKQVSDMYRKLRNTLIKYSLSILDGFDVNNDFQINLRNEDYYIVNHARSVLLEINKKYESYKFNDVIKLINKFTQDLSSWYFEYIKDSMYCLNKDDIVRKQIQTAVYFVLKNFLVALTPIIPHSTEEAYQAFTMIKDKKESIRQEDFFNTDTDFPFINKELSMLDNFFSIKDEINAVLEEARKNGVINTNNEAHLTIAEKMLTNDQLKLYPSLLKQWFMVAEVTYGDQTKVVNANYKKCLRCWNYFAPEKMKNDEIDLGCYEILKESNLLDENDNLKESV